MTEREASESLTYLSGQTIQGIYSNETISFGDLSVQGLTFIEAEQMPVLSLDGILGMGLYPRGNGHFIDSLIRAGEMDTPIFSFWIAEDSINYLINHHRYTSRTSNRGCR